MQFRKNRSALAALVCALLLAARADASVLTFGHSLEYLGGTPPTGTAPWVLATFDDHGSAGAVALTITSRLAAGEYLDRILFNFDPALDPTALRFSQDSATGAFVGAYVLKEANGLPGGGHTLFDIKLLFETSSGPGRFNGADSVSYTITGIPTLTAHSFDFGSVGGEPTNLPTAAHVLGIATPGVQIQTVTPTPGDGGWVTVPEPASAVLAGLCAAGLLSRCRRGAPAKK